MSDYNKEINQFQITKAEKELDLEDQIKVVAQFLGYKKMPMDIDTFMDDPYYMGLVSKNLYPFWRKLLRQIFPTPIHTSTPILVFTGAIGCVSGDTRILLADSSTKTIKELYETHPEGGFHVYSWDLTSNNLRSGLVTGVYHTGVKKVIKVTLSVSDSDSTVDVITTLDHKFLLNDGTYVEAKDLKSGVGIRSVYLSKGHDTGFYSEYKVYWDENSHHYQPVHRAFVGLNPGDGFEVHHIDGNKLNNELSNLTIVTKEEHHRAHYQDFNSNGSTIGWKLTWLFKLIYQYHPEYDGSPELFESYRSEFVEKGYIDFHYPHYHTIADYGLNADELIHNSKSYPDWNIDEESIKINLESLEAHRSRMIEQNISNSRSDVTFDSIESVCIKYDTTRVDDIAYYLNCSKSCVNSRIYEYYDTIKEFREYIQSIKIKNHTVISIEFLDDPIDVYDMTVDEYHNYGIEDHNGNVIFTHNTGKSTAVRFMFDYMKHRIECLINPYDTFEFVPGKNIKFSYFHKTSQLAYTDFIEVMDKWESISPYFKEVIGEGRLDLIEQVADSVRSENNIGSDVLCYNLSELNFIPYEKAHAKLNNALKRWSSRFERILNYFGLCIIDTSAQNDDSIADDFIMNNPYGSKVRAVHTNRWLVREHLNYYGRNGWFDVYMGDGTHQPFIVNPTKGRVITPDMDPDRILKVPEECRADFEFDLVTALQDIGGISVSASDRFFPDTTNLVKCFNRPQYTSDIVKFDFYDKTDKLVYRFARSLDEIPPNKIIYIRYDIGVTGDNTGLALAYFDKFKIYDSDKKVRQPMIEIPLAVGINRYEDEETPIYHLFEFVMDLNQRFEVGCFTADQYASRQLFQDLTREKVPNEYLSVDRNNDAYIYTKSLANAGLLSIASNEFLKGEMCDLRWIGRKVDHTSTGSKDISDAVVGVVYNLYQHIDQAGQMSKRYKAETHKKFYESRIIEVKDTFQDMIQGIY